MVGIMSNTVFSSEVDQQIFDEANAVLAANGLTISDAVGRMLAYIAEAKRLPSFEYSHRGSEGGRGTATTVYETLSFKELLEACPIDGIDLQREREAPRDIDI